MGTIAWSKPTAYDGRIYAGHIDSADPSRFTFRFSGAGFDMMVEGRLDDNDDVAFNVIDVKSASSR
jgi:hypothetical protein